MTARAAVKTRPRPKPKIAAAKIRENLTAAPESPATAARKNKKI
jgi:hypothetical protein